MNIIQIVQFVLFCNAFWSPIRGCRCGRSIQFATCITKYWYFLFRKLVFTFFQMEITFFESRNDMRAQIPESESQVPDFYKSGRLDSRIRIARSKDFRYGWVRDVWTSNDSYNKFIPLWVDHKMQRAMHICIPGS